MSIDTINKNLVNFLLFYQFFKLSKSRPTWAEWIEMDTYHAKIKRRPRVSPPGAAMHKYHNFFNTPHIYNGGVPVLLYCTLL